MSHRERRLDALIGRYGVESHYNRTTTGKRYAAILGAMIDGEQPAAASFDALIDALEWLASGYTNDPPRYAAELYDQDEDRCLAFNVEVKVVLV